MGRRILHTGAALTLIVTGNGAKTEQVATVTLRSAYSNRVAHKYNYRYGRNHPFLPSNIQTTNGEFFNPKAYPTAHYCGHCHQETHTEWRQSAHSNASRAPWYVKNRSPLSLAP